MSCRHHRPALAYGDLKAGSVSSHEFDVFAWSPPARSVGRREPNEGIVSLWSFVTARPGSLEEIRPAFAHRLGHETSL
jgi:hypothetical protein